jgi:hypothetical protein
LIPQWRAYHGVIGHVDKTGNAWSLLARDQDETAAAEINADIRKSFILGMELAMRICKNRQADLAVTHSDYPKALNLVKNQIDTLIGCIRIVQVEIGSGRSEVPNNWSQDEIDEVERIV